MSELIITDRPLKEFLNLFNESEELTVIALGDVWHPASGFVDETYFEPIRTVGDLLNINYNFKGLVIFIANIRGLLIEYHKDYYKITGDKKEIDKLKFNDLWRLNS